MKKGYDIKRIAFKQLGYVLCSLIIVMITSCGSKKDTVQNYNELQELINSREFMIEQEWMMPLGGGMINLLTTPNFMRFKDDRVEIFLPFFGVRHAGGFGDIEGGIQYEGPLENLEISKEENRRIAIKFEGRHKTENLQFHTILYPNGNSETIVSSSERNNISYRGEVKKLPDN